ncbi:MAG TPA: hypothetical protein VF503_13835 [Sphingobium sp.]|uniref:hypothetical protein n=1 Tax=Sphingobium sp. TaxID=1912891 RepID=UPI002ED2507E
MTYAFARANVLAVSMLTLALGACNKTNDTGANSNAALPALPAGVPLQSGPAVPVRAAPTVAALPAARPIRVGRPVNEGDAYAYLDRADGVFDAVGEAPPDYSYEYDGVAPWAWQTNAGDLQYAEAVDGGYRYYYYEPGADEPYLVRDPGYSYAYAGGVLVAMFTAAGALLPPQDYYARRDYASRYFWRARELREASSGQHYGVVAANWAAQRGAIDTARAQWAEARARQPAWSSYHAQHARNEQAHWQTEVQQRQMAATSFAAWQAHHFNGPQPGIHSAAAAASEPVVHVPAVPYTAIPAPQPPAPAVAQGQHGFGHDEPPRLASYPATSHAPVSGHQAPMAAPSHFPQPLPHEKAAVETTTEHHHSPATFAHNEMNGPVPQAHRPGSSGVAPGSSDRPGAFQAPAHPHPAPDAYPEPHPVTMAHSVAPQVQPPVAHHAALVREVHQASVMPPHVPIPQHVASPPPPHPHPAPPPQAMPHPVAPHPQMPHPQAEPHREPPPHHG